MKTLAAFITLTATAAAAHPGHGSLLGQTTEHALIAALIGAVIVAAVVIARRFARNNGNN